MKKILVSALLCIAPLLTSCEAEKSTTWYLENKNQLISKLSECNQSNKNNVNCVHADKAAEAIKLTVAKEFQLANRCRYNIDHQITLYDKIVNIAAACPHNDKNDPSYTIDQQTGTIQVNFTGDANGIWLTFTRRSVTIGGMMRTNQWTCSTTLAYEQFMPEICVSKLVYR